MKQGCPVCSHLLFLNTQFRQKWLYNMEFTGTYSGNVYRISFLFQIIGTRQQTEMQTGQYSEVFQAV